jgi:hypothetical protein
MLDFRGVYYATRCLLQHGDPYKDKDLLRVYQAEGGDRASDPSTVRRVVTMYIYLPTVFAFTVPFALLPWGPAHVLWVILTAGGLVLAGFLMWNLAESYSPTASLFLVCIVLANAEALFASGNAAGIGVSLCVVAVWCFLSERFVPMGILCLAVSLTIKPHDAGLVWLFFLLAGGLYRKRALQTLVVTAALSLPAILWVTHVSPNWLQELHSNMVATSAPGDLNDPSGASITSRSPGMIVDLQTAISIFWSNPGIYNLAAYFLCGPLLLLWAFKTVRSYPSPIGAWLALAAIAALSMLPMYHRQHDTKLLLLMIPACTVLWAKGGLTGHFALLVTAAGVTLTGDIPLSILMILTRNLHLSTATISGKILTVALMRPVSLILLAAGVFYLWVYVRHTPSRALLEGSTATSEIPIIPTIV